MTSRKSKRKRNEQFIIIFAASFIVVLIVYSLIGSAPNLIIIPTHTPDSSPDVPPIGPYTHLRAYWHLHLDIFINGTRVRVPSDLGHISDDTIYYAINTKDDSGVIDLQTPTINAYTLGEIFEIWGYPIFTSSQIFTYTGTNVNLYFNGTYNPFQAGYVLSCHAEVAVIVGTPPANIPSSYAFTSNEGCTG